MAQVAFSAEGKGHDSAGPPALMAYQTTHANAGGGWDGESEFIAPEGGFYFFTISCVRDASTGASNNDVRIYLRKNGADVGFAWCGSGSGTRSTGAYNVVLSLAQNDRVETFSQADADQRRLFYIYQFSGFLVL